MMIIMIIIMIISVKSVDYKLRCLVESTLVTLIIMNVGRI